MWYAILSRHLFSTGIAVVIGTTALGCLSNPDPSSSTAETSGGEGSEASGTATATSASTATGGGTMGEDVTSGSGTSRDVVDEAYCARFDAETCSTAVASDAPVQCAYFDPDLSSTVVDEPRGPACTSSANDFSNSRCLPVEYTPWACSLPAPEQASTHCGQRSEPPWRFYRSDSPETSNRFDLACEFRPVGWETCWENPVLSCWCPCLPFTCDGQPFCMEPTGGTGADTDTNASTSGEHTGTTSESSSGTG